MNKTILILLLLLLSASMVFAEDYFYPTTIGELNARVRVYGNGTITGLKAGEEVKFQTLTFQESEFQKVDIVSEALYINGKIFKPTHVLDDFDNKYAVFKIPENGDFTYELVADISTQSILHQMSDYTINKEAYSSMDATTEKIRTYLQPSEKIESNSTEIVTVEKNKLLSNSFLDTVDETVQWVNDYVEYAQGAEFNKYYLLQNSAIQTLLEKKGVCDEFANLGAALLRAKGVPTRIVTGITFDGKAWGNHAWIEVYHEKLGTWIPSDTTFRESGFVDATHIKTGAFTDVSLSLAKAFFPQTANVSFYTQTLPEVIINSKKFLGEVQLKTSTKELIANRWNKVTLTIKNLTNGSITAPISIRETYNEILIDNKKQSIILKPEETRSIEFNIYPKVDLEKNQIAKGTLTFNSLSPPYTQEFTIKPGTDNGSGELLIKDITPIAHNNKLSIQISALNLYQEDTNFIYDINSTSVGFGGTELVEGFTNKIITKDIQNYVDDAYQVKITTPTRIYTQILVPDKQKIIIAPRQDVNTVEIKQQIDTNKEKPFLDVILENPLIILVALLMGIVIMIFGLFWVNQKYI